MKLGTYSNMLRPAPTSNYISTRSHLAHIYDSRSKLLNLTGFFSSVGGIVGTPAGVELILWGSLVEDEGPDQGKRVLRRRSVSVL